MTALLDQLPIGGAVGLRADGLAPWRIRAGAFAVDVLPGAAVIMTMVLVCLTVPRSGVWWWVCICVAGAATLAVLVNRLLVPVVTGWSLGRALFGIAVTRPDGTSVGPWRLLVRDLAHLLDTASVFVGWLWPLWDSRRRTFADMLAGTQVRREDSAPPPAGVRRWVAAAVLVATALCAGGVAVGYAVVYSQERATQLTREQLAARGPKIVAQMLTYDPKSLEDDFGRARSLTTAKYRGKLAEQQEAVRKGRPVINEYYVTASSVLAASPDDATMLLFMQGRRGEGPEQRYITATVTVRFAKDDNQWRVDDLTVLAKPKPDAGRPQPAPAAPPPSGGAASPPPSAAPPPPEGGR